MVRKSMGELTANIEEMDEVIRDAWRPVNMRYADRSEPSLTAFMDRYRQQIRGSPMATQRLDAQACRPERGKWGERPPMA